MCVFVSANNYEPLRLYGCVVIGETVCLAACPSVRVCLWVFLLVCVCARVSMRQLVCAYQGKASEKFVDVTGVGAAAAAAAAATAVAGKHHQASSAISCVCELCVWQVQSQSRKLSMLIEIFCINKRTCASLQLCFPFLCVPFFQKLASRD